MRANILGVEAKTHRISCPSISSKCMRSYLLPNPHDISFILFLLKTVDIPFLLILSASLSLFSRIDCDNTVFENSMKKAHFATVWAKPVFFGMVM